jgi:hypothetical protein
MAEVFSWVGIAQKTWFGLVSPLPGISPSLHLDTAITLPSATRLTRRTRCPPGWPGPSPVTVEIARSGVPPVC